MEGQIYLNTQLWSVISGTATSEQAKKCLEAVHTRLATPYGLMLSAPPFIKTSIEVMRAVVYNPGIKENAGIFNHTQGWGVMAECLADHGDRAWEYYRSSMPAWYNTRAEIRQCEPYVQAQTTYSKFSPRPGNTRTSWLTGAAAWAYFSATQYILESDLRLMVCKSTHVSLQNGMGIKLHANSGGKRSISWSIIRITSARVCQDS